MRSISLFLAFLFPLFIYGQILSPVEFMPHEYGKAFTQHHMLVDYADYISDNSKNASFIKYGETNQNRALIALIISSENNLNDIENIRLNHLRSVGIEQGVVDENLNKSVVWLSFGVHGNEAGASESAMQLIYNLVTGSNGVDQKWLDDVIVIIDPCVNPDGFNRYSHHQINTNADYINVTSDDNEHREGWPSGRVNHYHHDLNRDWAWASQIETQQRLELYHKWLPHIHADFHEMYPGSPYYFAPAAEPLHDYLSPWQRGFQHEIGQHHAHYFNKENWLYYTREYFDLFYPSYGDTYPMFNGAIGMTYEQGGHGIAGRAILLENGDTLRLQDRIDHHSVTGMSTIEVAYKNKDRIVNSFAEYFESSRNVSQGKYEFFVIDRDENYDIDEFLELLDRHRIDYYELTKDQRIDGYSYKDFTIKSMNFKEGAIAIPSKQNHGIMAQVLLEPQSNLKDSITYDITAWSLLSAYGFKSVATNQQLSVRPFMRVAIKPQNVGNSYAYAITNQGMQSARLVSSLISNGIKCRVATKTFVNKGEKFERGTVLITQADNKNIALDIVINRELADKSCNIFEIENGFSESGPDLGSDKNELIRPGRILLVGGRHVDTYNYGQIWHYLDRELEVPYTQVSTDRLTQVDLRDFGIIILPEGEYGNWLSAELEIIHEWVSEGGKIIAIGSALRAFSNDDLFNLELQKEDSNEDEKEVKNPDHKLERYEESLRNRVGDWMPGAIVQLKLDDSHPLAFGLGKEYSSLKLSTMTLPHSDAVWNVGYIDDQLNAVGFIGSRIKDKLTNTNTFFVKEVGSGQFIGMVDNPLYRSFWFRGKQLFFNALFFVN